jgi:uncharacterized protein with PIN domain
MSDSSKSVYALAKESGEPLLFNGSDFSHTDIVAAWPTAIL